jgi:hypothetical protein
MRWAGNVEGTGEKIHTFYCEILKERDNLGDQGIDVRIILKRILQV